MSLFVVRTQQQVRDLLHVYLQEADRHSEYSLVGILLDVTEDALNGSGHYAILVLAVVARCTLSSLVKPSLRSRITIVD